MVPVTPAQDRGRQTDRENVAPAHTPLRFPAPTPRSRMPLTAVRPPLNPRTPLVPGGRHLFQTPATETGQRNRAMLGTPEPLSLSQLLEEEVEDTAAVASRRDSLFRAGRTSHVPLPGNQLRTPSEIMRTVASLRDDISHFLHSKAGEMGRRDWERAVTSKDSQSISRLMEENQTLRARLQHAESALQHSKQRRQSSSSTFESAEVASAKASLKQRTLELALEQERTKSLVNEVSELKAELDKVKRQHKRDTEKWSDHKTEMTGRREEERDETSQQLKGALAECRGMLATTEIEAEKQRSERRKAEDKILELEKQIRNLRSSNSALDVELTRIKRHNNVNMEDGEPGRKRRRAEENGPQHRDTELEELRFLTKCQQKELLRLEKVEKEVMDLRIKAKAGERLAGEVDDLVARENRWKLREEALLKEKAEAAHAISQLYEWKESGKILARILGREERILGREEESISASTVVQAFGDVQRRWIDDRAELAKLRGRLEGGQISPPKSASGNVPGQNVLGTLEGAQRKEIEDLRVKVALLESEKASLTTMLSIIDDLVLRVKELDSTFFLSSEDGGQLSDTQRGTLLQKRCGLLFSGLKHVVSAAFPEIEGEVFKEQAPCDSATLRERLSKVVEADQAIADLLLHVDTLESTITTLSGEADTFRAWQAKGIYDSSQEKVLRFKRNPMLLHDVSETNAQAASAAASSALIEELSAKVETLEQEKTRANRVKDLTIRQHSFYRDCVEQTLGFHVRLKDDELTLRPIQVVDKEHVVRIRVLRGQGNQFSLEVQSTPFVEAFQAQFKQRIEKEDSLPAFMADVFLALHAAELNQADS